MKTHDGCTTIELRRRFAAEAFALSAKYDAAISSWFAKQLNPEQKTDVIVTRPYLPVRELKYGVNPHQKPAGLYRHINSFIDTLYRIQKMKWTVYRLSGSTSKDPSSVNPKSR